MSLELNTYVLKLEYEGGKPVPFASVVVGDPKVASESFSPDQNGIVRLGLGAQDKVTVSADGFPERTVRTPALKAGATNVVVVK